MDINLLEPLNGRIGHTLATIDHQNNVIGRVYRMVVVLFQFWISSLAIIWLSVFIYLMLYYGNIPPMSTQKDIFIQYHSTCDRAVRDMTCNVPTARVAFRPVGRSRGFDFVRGQVYRFSIDLLLPESEVNWAQGMFMVRLKLVDNKQRVMTNVAKPTGLRYKSTPLRYIVTLLYWPLFVLGLAEENQKITVDLIDDYTEGSYAKAGPLNDAIIEFEARDVQIYPPTVLKVTATLTGFRYYMYNHWFTSFLVGTGTIASFLYLIAFFGFANYARVIFYNNLNNGHNHNHHVIPTDRPVDQQIIVPRVAPNNDNNDQRVGEEQQESGLTGELPTVDYDSESNVQNLDTEETEQLPDSSIG